MRKHHRRYKSVNKWGVSCAQAHRSMKQCLWAENSKHVAAARTHAPPSETLWWMSGIRLAQYKTWREGPWSWDSSVYIRDKGITKICSTVIRSWGPIVVAKLGQWENLGFYLCSYTSLLRNNWSPYLVNFSSKMFLLFKREWTHLKISGHRPKCKRKLIFIILWKLPNPTSTSSCNPNDGETQPLTDFPALQL